VPQREPTPETWQLDVGIGFSLNGTFAQRYRMARNGGAVYGYATELALLPEERLGVYAVATREVANDSVQAIAHWALEAALAARSGARAPEYHAPARPAAGLAARLARCSTTDVDPAFAPYVGRYGWEHNPLVICQLDGKLHALVEWYSLYPLTDQGNGVFAFPSYALFGQEQLWFVRNAGMPTDVVIGHGAGGVHFPRMTAHRSHAHTDPAATPPSQGG